MKPLLILILSLSLSIAAFGQTITLTYGDTAYMRYWYGCSRGNGFALKEHLKDGHYIVMWKADSVKFKYIDAHYKNNQLNGVLTHYYPSGIVSSKDIFKNGKEEGRATTYYKNGKIEFEIEYANGSSNGTWYSYNEDGSKSSETTYKDGDINGMSISYYKSGKVESKENFKNGKLDGCCLYYYENGVVQRELYYSNDKAVGLWKYYDEYGRESRTVTMGPSYDQINDSSNSQVEQTTTKTDTTEMVGQVVKEQFISQGGKKVEGIYDYYFESGTKKYFIKTLHGKYTKKELDEWVHFSTKIKAIVMEKGDWGDDCNEQSRVGQYIILLEIKAFKSGGE